MLHTWTCVLSGLAGTQRPGQRRENGCSGVNKNQRWMKKLLFRSFDRNVIIVRAPLSPIKSPPSFKPCPPCPPPPTPVNPSQSEVSLPAGHTPMQLMVNKREVHVPECSLSAGPWTLSCEQTCESGAGWRTVNSPAGAEGGNPCPALLQGNVAIWSCDDSVTCGAVSSLIIFVLKSPPPPLTCFYRFGCSICPPRPHLFELANLLVQSAPACFACFNTVSVCTLVSHRLLFTTGRKLQCADAWLGGSFSWIMHQWLLFWNPNYSIKHSYWWKQHKRDHK